MNRETFKDKWRDFRKATFDKWAKETGVLPNNELKNVGTPELVCYDSKDVFDNLFMRDNYLHDAKKNKKIRYFFYYTIPWKLEYWMFHLPSDIYYFFHWRFVGKYHIIKLGGPGYYDPCKRIDLALEKIFDSFLEEAALHQAEGNALDYLKFHAKQKSYAPEARKAWKELIKVYEYFKKDRPELKQKIEDMFQESIEIRPGKRDYTYIWKLEEELKEKDTYYFGLIVKHRGYLWT